jgi:hypothetical protein
MEPAQLDFSDEYTTPVCSTDMVNMQQTPILSIWITPLGRDLYEKFNFSRPPFDPLTSIGAEVGPSGQTIDRPIKKVINHAST